MASLTPPLTTLERTSLNSGLFSHKNLYSEWPRAVVSASIKRDSEYNSRVLPRHYSKGAQP